MPKPRQNKIKVNFTKTKLIIFLVVVAISLVTLFFSKTFEGLFGINTPFYTDVSSSSYKVHFVDVGQGDCTVFEFSNGDVMVVDSGKAKSKNQLKEYLDKVIFANRTDKNITYLVATHSDEDHIGNMCYILETYDVKNVYRPKILSKSETTATGNGVCTTNVYDEFIKAANAEPDCNVEIVVDGLNVITSEYSFCFYGPMQNAYEDVNDYCPFLFVEEYGKYTLITGDASQSVEEEIILAKDESLINKVDVYQCGHHGSKTSTSDLLLDTIEIKFCVISAGKDNSYGHPHAETLAKLNERNIKTLNTIENGNIVFGYNENGEIALEAQGSISALDSVKWWMVVVVFDVTFGIILFSIKIKIKKRL